VKSHRLDVTERLAFQIYGDAVNDHCETAARVILAGVRKNRARVLVGNDAKALDFLARVTGSGYQWLVSAVDSTTRPPTQ
jgi:hypothetical protein